MDQAAGETWGTLAGFWVRLLADLIDTAFLFLVGLLLSIPFGPLLVRLGSRGVFIGLAVSLLYNGVLQSRLGTGQTLGKRWLRLTVVRMDGSLMSIERSLVRYAMVGYLVYQNAISTAIVTVLPFLRFEWIDEQQS
jgi:uncharacterized RDD family membrane protein YckC